MLQPLANSTLDQLFRTARTHSAWQDKAVTTETLQQLYDLLKWGPTAANSCPARFIFITTPDGKARLEPALSEGNLDQTMKAPVTVIVARDLEFYEHLPKLFPHTDARSWYAGNAKAIENASARNGTLQGAYLIVAARALGLDCGPMSGFDADKVNTEFFPDGKVKANFLCNLGYGDSTKLYP
ncbi:MAG: malonic semialdehyde reductase, partial [Gammaproteobacteria bacterium]|nr:malonic semialdehyde reductase [Gammaproteobacteria bacterium]